MITAKQIIAAINCYPAGLNHHFDSIMAACHHRQINTPQRMAAFLANAAHETGGFKAFVENLNYSASGLLATFPSRVNAEQAAKLARNPILIANHVYANRYGNTDQGDGWKYRGRGIFQTTFKENYAKATKDLGIDFVSDPDKLAEPPYAAQSAAFFWHSKKLNALADKGDIKGIRRAINPALKGYEKVAEYYESLIKVLKQ